MLEVNTKVMIRSEKLQYQAFNGHIGTITNKYYGVFEVRLNGEKFQDWMAVCHEEELVNVADLEMPIEPVDPEQMKKWTAEAKERAGA